jgi:hypothetical protein
MFFSLSQKNGQPGQGDRYMQPLFARYEPSRHDTQMLTPRRTAPADPYGTWIDKREAERGASVAAELTTPYGRFMRGEPMSWVASAAAR